MLPVLRIAWNMDDNTLVEGVVSGMRGAGSGCIDGEGESFGLGGGRDMDGILAIIFLMIVAIITFL